MNHLTNKTTKTLAIALSSCLVLGAAGAAYSVGGGTIYDRALESAKSANESASKALSVVSGDSDASTGNTESGKDETVYVIANAQGGAQEVIVSDELKNSSKAVSLSDKSCLSDISNLKGSETYKDNSDGTMTWDAQGNDIYYQGKADKTLPVNISVSYSLDGKAISADEIAGKSGKVVIRFDYSIDESAFSDSKDIVPFLTITGMMLDNNSFSNISVSNGKVINDGDRNIVTGFALPGAKESLGLKGDSVDIPDYFEVSADAENFALGSTVTYASCDFAKDIDTENMKSIDDLTDALDQVSSAVTQLADGSSTLYDGLCTLLKKSGEMSNGIGSLYSGAAELSTGLATLDSNSGALKSGAYQVFTTLTTAAQTQLNAALAENGYEAVTLTPDNYSSVLGALLDKFSGGAYSQAEAAAEAQIRPAVQAAVREQVTKGVNETVKAALIEKDYTDEQADTYLQTSEGTATVNTYVEQKMATDEIKQIIDSNVASKLASDEVQSKITEAVNNGLAGNASYSKIKALKASLDSYAAFYAGLSSYTAGVSSAANGANQLTGGLGQLKTGGESLVSGVTQLRDGAMQLSDGMSEFCSKLSSELGSLSGSELKDAIPRISSMLDAAKNYDNFSGIAEGSKGSVKFIIKTASIGD